MSQVQKAFSRNKSFVATAWGGVALIGFVTALSCVSSFVIYREGFTDLGRWGAIIFATLAVLVNEGGFSWFLFGYTRTFSTLLERALALAGMGFLIVVMATNIITHFMMVKALPLNSYQLGWVNWGAVVSFVVVMILAICIKLANPQTRLLRQELRVMGKEIEVTLTAKNEALESDRIQTAISRRARIEAEALAERIERGGVFSEPEYEEWPHELPGKSQRR